MISSRFACASTTTVTGRRHHRTHPSINPYVRHHAVHPHRIHCQGLEAKVIATFYEKAAFAGVVCIDPMARRFGPVLTNPIGTQ